MDFLSPQLVWIEKRCYRVNNQAPIEPEKLPERNEYVEEGENRDSGNFLLSKCCSFLQI